MRERKDKTVIKPQENVGETFDFGNRIVSFYVESNRKEKINQVCDCLYPLGDYKIPYHYHDCGTVTFMIRKGRLELTLNGKRCICEEGDMVNIPAHCPYGILILDKNTLVREIYTDLDMLEAYRDDEQMKTGGCFFPYTPEIREEFEEKHHYFSLTEPVETEAVDKRLLPQISTEEKAIYEYNGREGITCRLKAGRWDLNRTKEIWEYRISKNYQLQYFNPDQNERIYSIKSGKVMIEINDKVFFAEAGDLVHVPAYRGFAITAVEDDTCLYDLNVSARLFRMLEMLELAQREEEENTKDEGWMRALLELNNSNLTGFVKTDFTIEEGA